MAPPYRPFVTQSMMIEVATLLEGYTQPEIADVLGVGKTTVNECMRGERTIKKAEAVAIVNAILNAAESARSSNNAATTFHIGSGAVEFRAAPGLEMWAERREHVFTVEVRSPALLPTSSVKESAERGD